MAATEATNHHMRNGQQPAERGERGERGDWGENDLAQILAAIDGPPLAGRSRPAGH